MTTDRGPSPRVPLAPAGVVGGLVVALCAVLLLRWLAVVALAVLIATAVLRWVLRWARGEISARQVLGRVGAARARRRPAPGRRPGPDCSWCGRPGGHLDGSGERLRPRHVHVFR